ncbi:hypothetical protein [Schaalia sp. Marseille-Q2122]|uniref:hypothetical protein n=1 Tax=Schaalia sp. Marseille-Q2122 TaxID=2736604 RepID=UPI00158E4980|nr:hypothetical protein [Schaalia sp. Marseille-Q2122]
MAERPFQPRRPAMLDPQAADAIVGDTDPALASELAHTSAWALLGVGDEEFDAAVERLRASIADEGVDAVAHMWSRSPEFTLPGAMWRIFLLSEWVRRDHALVEERFAQGVSALRRQEEQRRQEECRQEQQRSQDGQASQKASGNPDGHSRWPEALSVEAVDARCLALLHGQASDDDLEGICLQAAALMRVLAAGENAQWIEDPSDPLAHPVTTRARALLRTAEELEDAASRARVGKLD